MMTAMVCLYMTLTYAVRASIAVINASHCACSQALRPPRTATLLLLGHTTCMLLLVHKP